MEHGHHVKALPRSARSEQASLHLVNPASAVTGAGQECYGNLGRGRAFQRASSVLTRSLVESQRPGGAFSRCELFTHASLPV